MSFLFYEISFDNIKCVGLSDSTNAVKNPVLAISVTIDFNILFAKVRVASTNSSSKLKPINFQKCLG